jgi:myo-inositol-1-phosphate synthase
MGKKAEKVGLWLVGACGGVGTAIAVGIEAIRRGRAEPLGLIGHLPAFAGLKLAPLDRWILGGHEIRKTRFEASAREMWRQSNVFGLELIEACRPWLRQCDREIRDGVLAHCGPTVTRMADRARGLKGTPAALVDVLADDISAFARRHRLDHVVVLNVASTEPPFPLRAELSAALVRKGPCPVPASSLYALAAIEAGASYINFTPSRGIDVPALRHRADAAGIAYMGSDGKTGETMMKSVLAPMFAARNLRVMSWVGHNIFGNRDGVVLDDPRNKAAKTRSKDHLVGDILGYKPKTLVSIEYIESLDDWKTAWDHIHFQGFLGTKMVLQFIWQGCDSMLAAPLAIEMARFAERAARAGESGAMTHLACLFKSPMDVQEQGFGRQYEMLLDYARTGKKTTGTR